MGKLNSLYKLILDLHRDERGAEPVGWALSAIVSALQWTINNIVLPVISWVWTIFKPIWDAFYPWVKKMIEWATKAIDWIDTQVKKIIPQEIIALWNSIKALFAKIDEIYKSTWGQIEKIFAIFTGKFEEVWREFERVRDIFLKLLSIVSSDLAKKIYDATESLEKRTLGWIKDLEHTLFIAITKFRNELYIEILTLGAKLATRLGLHETWIKLIDEAWKKLATPTGALTETTIKQTTILHGKALWDWLFSPVLHGPQVRGNLFESAGEALPLVSEQLNQIKLGHHGEYRDTQLVIDRVLWELKGEVRE